YVTASVCSTSESSSPLSPCFFLCSGVHRDLHSFPTRRSSDLGGALGPGGAGRVELEILRPSGAKLVLIDPTDSERVKTARRVLRSEEHTSELQSRENLVCRLLLEKKNNNLYQNEREIAVGNNF